MVTTRGASSEAEGDAVVTVDLVREEEGFVVLKGVGHTVPAGTLLFDGKAEHAVGYVAYNMKDMDPTELRAVGLPLAPGGLREGQELTLLRGENLLRAPKAADVLGKVVDCLGLAAADFGEGSRVPLFNDYPGVDDRQPIGENFHTGVKAVDAIVPVGVGQSMLVMGKRGTRKTTMALDVLLAHGGGKSEGGHTFVYACDERDLGLVRATLREAGIEDRTVVVTSRSGSQSAGRRYTALLQALAIAEDVRDSGGHAVVFLDDLSAAVKFWESVCQCETSLSDEDMEELMEVDGMLIARYDALQRQFFSNILQRSAKMSDKLGGGSLTLFGLLQGEPMREDKMDLGVKILKQQNLSPEMREKLLLALAQQVKEKDGVEDGSDSASGSSFVSTRSIEEFKSISDGHILMCDSNAARQEDTYDIVPSLSTTRLGVGRVAAPSMIDLCSSLQLMLQQSLDAKAYGDLHEDSTSSQDTKSTQVLRLLTQTAGQPVPLERLREDLVSVLEREKEAVVNA
ncbi:P-loop-containing nucleoside triphosphate hydrolase [Chloropicon primus]|uniref:P-loop-containing nucleoside triphosphate hydrolase n=1 Tax=Chloropicon primus TaxID=1764295 RepID=A0A5B8MX51_9CHLO|nr:P-loop-containing nucleoside triphosphate hydrolase [Chloropicon primus]UPR03323.1 P-loop-containing nucleoside triphosphate hydrolase [Chloropicon primus]|eukprot:QDZ24114.1 P-loop-containing nucleoside triphosphate hydrolase [Chloropicon primus]